MWRGVVWCGEEGGGTQASGKESTLALQHPPFSHASSSAPCECLLPERPVQDQPSHRRAAVPPAPAAHRHAHPERPIGCVAATEGGMGAGVSSCGNGRLTAAAGCWPASLLAPPRHSPPPPPPHTHTTHTHTLLPAAEFFAMFNTACPGLFGTVADFRKARGRPGAALAAAAGCCRALAGSRCTPRLHPARFSLPTRCPHPTLPAGVRASNPGGARFQRHRQAAGKGGQTPGGGD